MKQRIARIHDLLGLLNVLYPPSLAEEWDNPGVQAGDLRARVNKVLVCLDPSEHALRAAAEAGAEALLCHHPLLLKPLRNLTLETETGRILFAAIRNRIAVLAAHTNLDRAANGLNDWFATALGLESCRPLQDGDASLVKVIVYVPSGYESPVARALFEAGAGHVGDYDNCSFRSEGIGTFRPAQGCTPFMGTVGEQSRVREVRLETVIPRDRLQRAVDRMVRAHPYEEVAYDLVPLANRRTDCGLGRIGRLEEPKTLQDFAGTVKEALRVPALRTVGDPRAMVAKVAVCGGSGAGLLREAARQGADVLVTGDIKYHEAREAAGLGLALVDAGHFATERLMIGPLAETLTQAAAAQGLEIAFVTYEGEEDPFKMI